MKIMCQRRPEVGFTAKTWLNMNFVNELQSNTKLKWQDKFIGYLSPRRLYLAWRSGLKFYDLWTIWGILCDLPRARI